MGAQQKWFLSEQRKHWQFADGRLPSRVMDSLDSS